MFNCKELRHQLDQAYSFPSHVRIKPILTNISMAANASLYTTEKYKGIFIGYVTKIYGSTTFRAFGDAFPPFSGTQLIVSDRINCTSNSYISLNGFIIEGVDMEDIHNYANFTVSTETFNQILQP
jgi:hypothetical protein